MNTQLDHHQTTEAMAVPTSSEAPRASKQTGLSFVDPAPESIVFPGEHNQRLSQVTAVPSGYFSLCFPVFRPEQPACAGPACHLMRSVAPDRLVRDIDRREQGTVTLGLVPKTKVGQGGSARRRGLDQRG
jgi:hypothetical protein